VTTTADIQLPLINLNGTSAEELKRLNANAYYALKTAIEAVHAAAPHGRDYQTVPGAYQAARAEHIARVNRLSDIQDEYIAILTEIGKSIRSDP